MKIARYGELGKGNPLKLQKNLTKVINLMDELGFEYDSYEDWDGYEAMMDGVEAYNTRSWYKAGSDSD